MGKGPNIIAVRSSDLRKIEGIRTGVQNRLTIERDIVPIVFVPGIMGSRLGKTAAEKVWDPDDAWFMLTTYGRRRTDAKWKKKLLIGEEFHPDYLNVLNEDEKHDRLFADKSDPARSNRGWGGVSWSSYGGFLKALQNNIWNQTVNLFFEFPVYAFGYNWTASNDTAGKKLAAYLDEIITRYAEKGRTCTKVLLVTHSMGGLVARSACLLHGAKDKVLGVIHGVQPSNGSPAAYWRMKAGFERPHTIPDLELEQWFRDPVKMFKHTKDRVLGTQLIGVPFTDMKLGLGNISAWVLGTDGEEVTALLGNMPGGLQLLPNKQYKNNEGSSSWLELEDSSGNTLLLPHNDPFKEIYNCKEAFYRLVNPTWLNPGSKLNRRLEENDWCDWSLYEIYLAEAERFHDSLASAPEQAHPETYQFYSSGIASPDRVVFSRAEDSVWETVKRQFPLLKDLPGDALVFKKFRAGGNPLTPVLIDAVESVTGVAALKDSDWYTNRGGYRDRVGANDHPGGEGELQLVTMQLPDGAGDGTVPESSARALELPDDTQRTFCIADMAEIEVHDEKSKRLKPKRKVDFDEGYFDRGHEPIFKTKSAQFITFTAIENICRKEIRKMLEKG